VETSCLPTGAGEREGAPFFRRRRVEKCNVRTVSAGEKYCRDWPHPHVIMLLGGAKRNMDSQCGGFEVRYILCSLLTNEIQISSFSNVKLKSSTRFNILLVVL
jgi:hypothetical protein